MCRPRNGEWQNRGDQREKSDLGPRPGEDHLSRRESEDRFVVGQPYGVVVPLVEQSKTLQIELRELTCDQLSGQLLADHDLWRPRVHPAIVTLELRGPPGRSPMALTSSSPRGRTCLGFLTS